MSQVVLYSEFKSRTLTRFYNRLMKAVVLLYGISFIVLVIRDSGYWELSLLMGQYPFFTYILFGLSISLILVAFLSVPSSRRIKKAEYFEYLESVDIVDIQALIVAGNIDIFDGNKLIEGLAYINNKREAEAG